MTTGFVVCLHAAAVNIKKALFYRSMLPIMWKNFEVLFIYPNYEELIYTPTLCFNVTMESRLTPCVRRLGVSAGVQLTSFGERMEMKSSYIWRTFSSTTVLLVSFFSSSQASQNIMFSSLNSVRRNCLKQLHPAALFITFSKDVDQERASSRVGVGLTGQRKDSRHGTFLLFFTAVWKRDGVWRFFREKVPVPFFTVDGDLCPTLADRPLYGLVLAPNSQTGELRSTLCLTSPSEMVFWLDLLLCGQMFRKLTF